MTKELSRTVEYKRLMASQARQADWKNWGPYLSERVWGKVGVARSLAMKRSFSAIRIGAIIFSFLNPSMEITAQVQAPVTGLAGLH